MIFDQNLSRKLKNWLKASNLQQMLTLSDFDDFYITQKVFKLLSNLFKYVRNQIPKKKTQDLRQQKSFAIDCYLKKPRSLLLKSFKNAGSTEITMAHVLNFNTSSSTDIINLS